MPPWQREYERDWRDAARRAIAHRFGAYALPCAPSVTLSDEQLLQDVLTAAGIAHVPLRPSDHWKATRPVASPSLVDDASYVFSTPPPVDEFPAFSSTDFDAYAASGRRGSASQRLQLRLADVSPLAASHRRSSMDRAATISPLAAATSGQWPVADKTRQKTLESSFRDKELDLSMHSMHLSDEEEGGECGEEEMGDGVCMEDEERDIEATQVIEVLEDDDDDDHEAMGVVVPGRDGDREVELVQQIEDVQVDVDAQSACAGAEPWRGDAGDPRASRWLDGCRYKEDEDIIQTDGEEKGKQVHAHAVVEVRDGDTDTPLAVDGRGDLVASGRMASGKSIEEPVWHSEADFELGTGAEYDSDFQRSTNEARDGETRHLSQHAVESPPYTLDALQTVAEPEREEACDQARQQDMAATVKPVDSPTLTKDICAARQHDPMLTGQSTSASSADSMAKKALYASTTAPSTSEESCTTTAALSTDRGLTASPVAPPGNGTEPATSSAMPATRALHTSTARLSASEVAQRYPTTAPALRRSVLSRKRATRGTLLHTKLPLQMECRFASDRRRHHKRRKSSAVMPGVSPFVVPELAIELKSYQKEALRWMLEREQEPGDTIIIDRQQHGATRAVDALVAKVRGGILADEMGLGKTVCCLALICASLRQARAADAQSSNDTGSTVHRITPPTLIVTPLSILSQWEQEIRAKTNLSVVTYQGAARKNFHSSTQFMGTDIVLSTYDTLRLSECKVRGKGGEGNGRNGCGAEDGWHQAPRLVPRLQKSVATSRLHQLEWFRVILDESHLIANAGCGRARAAFTLNGRRRWCVTGTPIQNRTADLAALLQFVGLGVRAHALSERELGLMVPRVVLRRLKSTVDMWSRAPILELPEKSETTIELDFASDIERALYMLLYRSTKRQVLRYLQSKEAKRKTRQASCTSPANIDEERPLFMHVFELILRLRQVCNSCALVTADPLADVQMRVEKLAGNAGPDGMSSFSHADAELLKRFQKQRPGANGDSGRGSLESTKLTALLKELKRVRANRERALVISQWTSFLDMIGERLDVHNAQCEARDFGGARDADNEAIAFAKLDGRMSAKDREQVVRNFQQQEDSVDKGSSVGPPLDVLLLSLRTGGLGLNLTAAAHVFIMEPSWNPSLEHQAIDRAHRFGQTRQVRVIRFVVKGSIEERVMALQTKKCQLTAAFLGDGETASSAKPKSRRCETRLSTRDIRTLFLTQQEQVEVVDLRHLDGIRGHARDDEVESSDRSVTCIEISD